jgi:adenine-specific DNA-methyltransferase
VKISPSIIEITLRVLSSKQYLNNESGEQRKTKAQSLIDDIFTQDGTKEIESIFEDAQIFSFPKPNRLIKKLIEIGGVEESDIILDFFAGSATTAHAMLDLNKQDNGNRKFILVQLPEPCSPDSEAFKAGYKTIADIGKERIRRVIKKIEKEQTTQDKKNAEALPGMVKEQSAIDLGFKVLKLNKSNFKPWQKLDPSAPVEKIEKQLELHIDYINPEATPEDLLYEILLKAGFPPTEKIETKIIAGINVFSVSDGGLLFCLEKPVTKELIDAVAEAEPMLFICLDSAFHGNDQLKANSVQTFAARNMQREKHNKIIFKTV